MPALFAYLIALGLVLGGGYGALSWLAAPEPVKVVAKAKPKPPAAHTASIPEPNSSERSQPQAVEAARAEPASSDKPQSSEPDARVAAREQGAYSDQSQSDQSERAADRQAAVRTEASAAEAARSSPAEATSQATRLAPQRESGPQVRESKQEHKQQNKQPAEAAPPPATSVAAAARPKRPHSRQASRPSEKRALALMTLRTIEFPDGRRVTQLIPYRDDRRAMAFDPDW
jgi:hypothetical protein